MLDSHTHRVELTSESIREIRAFVWRKDDIFAEAFPASVVTKFEGSMSFVIVVGRGDCQCRWVVAVVIVCTR